MNGSAIGNHNNDTNRNADHHYGSGPTRNVENADYRKRYRDKQTSDHVEICP